MDTLGLDDETPIENKMITNTIESAQKKLEAQNFSTRKNVLQFDDVMNKQRETIYGQRRQVLNGEDLKETLRTMMKDKMCIRDRLPPVCSSWTAARCWSRILPANFLNTRKTSGCVRFFPKCFNPKTTSQKQPGPLRAA